MRSAITTLNWNLFWVCGTLQNATFQTFKYPASQEFGGKNENYESGVEKEHFSLSSYPSLINDSN